MAQKNLNLDPETLLGTELISELNLWAAAVKSLHSGATRPSYLTAGGMWVDTSAAGFLTLKLYDGASDVALATVTTATHALALAAHSHAISDVTGLQTALDGKSAAGHGHALEEISGLVAALAGKSATGHGHALEDVTGLAAALAGNWSHVGSLTASADATLEFTDLDEFDEYEFIFDDVLPANDGVQFKLRLSSDNGVSFNSGASDYSWAIQWVYDTSTTASAYNGVNVDDIRLVASGLAVGNGASEGVCGSVFLHRHKNASVETRVTGRLIHNYSNANQLVHSRVGGRRKANEVSDAAQFFFDSGNIASGSIHLLGRNYTT
jgi:hypothetical protein